MIATLSAMAAGLLFLATAGSSTAEGLSLLDVTPQCAPDAVRAEAALALVTADVLLRRISAQCALILKRYDQTIFAVTARGVELRTRAVAEALAAAEVTLVAGDTHALAEHAARLRAAILLLKHETDEAWELHGRSHVAANFRVLAHAADGMDAASQRLLAVTN